MSQKAQPQMPPRLRNLDDLFSMKGHASISGEDTGVYAGSNDAIMNILSIAQTVSFPNHPFRLYRGERLSDMVESIKKNGILVPIIVREVDGKYQILSGHNRVNAARLAGMNCVPAIVKTGLTEHEARTYVIETNLLQRSFSDMAHSEKAAVIAMYHSELFSQGKRNDIIAELKRLENPDEYRDESTSAQIVQRLNSREIVAQEYGLDRGAVARYLRIDKLTPALKQRLDDKEIPFVAAVSLSFISEENQGHIDKCVELNKYKIDLKKATALREYSDKNKLNEDSVYLILSGEVEFHPKSNVTPTVRIRRVVFDKYFKSNQSPREIQSIIEQALDLYYAALEVDKTG